MATLFRQLEAFHSDVSNGTSTSTLQLQKTEQRLSRQLPQEIFDHIVDYFHDQPDALRICALVSSQWLSSARTHIFYRITLGPPKIATRSSFFSQRKPITSCQRLYEVIESQINLGSELGGIPRYIREIHLREGVLKHEWISQEPTLPRLLRTLNNVRRLEIRGAVSIPLNWKRLSLDVKSTLLDHTLRLESFSELKLSNFFFPTLKDTATFLCTCRDLKILEIEHVQIADDSADEELGGSEKEVGKTSSLDMLVIGPRTSTAFITSFLLHPSTSITLQTVRKLSLSISGDFARFARLLHASTFVEKLEVTLMSDVNLEEYFSLPSEDRFHLYQVPYLRDLKVNVDILQKMEDPLPWLSALLATGADTRQSMVKTISVLYSLYLPAPYMDRYTYNGIFSKWSDIDNILCGVVASESERTTAEYGYKSLESVELEFALENPIGFGVAPRFLKELVLESPGLRSKGMLHIHAFDTSR